MNLENLYQLYLEQAKQLALTLLDNDRIRACQWIKKIEVSPNSEEKVKKLQLHSLKLLLLCLECNCLTGPFEKSPEDDKEFEQYDWNSFDLAEFSSMIRSKKETCNNPNISYNVSGNRRQLVTYQNDPATGQHCYYACSKKPIEEWKNLKSGVIQNESVKDWKERGELEELNGKESQNSSIDIPRCVMQSTNPQVDFHIFEERHSGRDQMQSQRMPNLSNNSHCVTPGHQRHTNYNIAYSGRPETPQVFGGTGRQARPFEAEQFGLSKNEEFRSPRGVFQNLDYDRFQTHKTTMQPRLTDEVITSFDNARIRRGQTSSSTKDNDARQKLCARLQKVRNEMHTKPQIEIQEQIEVEPENYHYEPITLQEPCEYASRHQETDQDLGILSAEEMDDEDLFDDQETIDPKTIFKTRDENLVSRNVVKIETNTTINGSKREVVEEFLEQEDVNVEERSEDDENLVDVSEPTFESVPGYSPLQLSDQIQKKLQKQQQYKPRRILEDYSDLPNEDLEDISQPCFQQRSFCPEEESGTRQDHPQTQAGIRRLPTERLDEISQPEFVSSIENPTTFRSGNKPFFNALDRLEKTIQEVSRRRALFGGVNNSDRLENISQPIFESSYENSSHRPYNRFEESERLENIEQPDYQSFEESTSRINQSRTRERPFPQIYTKERLDQVCQPSFASSLKDASVNSRISRGMTLQRQFPQVETSERLDEVSQPHLFHSTGVSYQDSRSRRCPCSKRPIPQFDTSERLDDISRPSFEQSLRDSMVTSRQGERRRLPDVETSEELDEVSQPRFLHSTGVSYQDPTRRRCPLSQRPIPQVDTSERLDDISQPNFESSTVNSRQRGQRCLPEVGTSERLDEVSQPRFLHSAGDPTGRRCPLGQRPIPQVDTSERLDDISRPSFEPSLRDSTVPSRQGERRRLPEVETSERLDEVSQLQLLHSTGTSYQDSRSKRCPQGQRQMHYAETSERLDDISRPSFGTSLKDSIVTRQGERRRLPEVGTSERLDEVSQPRFLHSTGVSYKDSTRRGCPLSQRPIPQVDTSERLEEISQPNFESSLRDSRETSSQRRRLPEVETSERLDEVSQPRFLHSTGVSYQDKTSRRCPLSQRPILQVDTSERLDEISRPNFESSLRDSTVPSKQRDRRRLPEVETSERLDEVSQPRFLHSTGASYQDSRSKRCQQSQGQMQMHYPETSERLDDISRPSFGTSLKDSIVTRQGERRRLPEVGTSERLDEVSQPRFLHSTGVSYQDSTSRRPYGGQRPLPQFETSERLDEISQPNFESSLRDSTVTSKQRERRQLPEVETSEKLNEISQPEFLHSTGMSYQDSRSRKCPPCQRPMPFAETSERLDEVSCPKFLSSTEDSGQSSRRPHFQLRESQRLDEVTQPSGMKSLRDSTMKSRGRKGPSQVDKCEQLIFNSQAEILDDVSQPLFQSSFEESKSKSRGNRDKLVPRRQFQDDESEWLEDICQPEFASSVQTSSFQEGRRTPHRKNLPSVDASERLENICEPEFPSSFEDTSDTQRTGMQNVSERLDHVSQPFFPSSIEESCRKLRDIKKAFSEPRQLPQVDESEILNQVTQPDLTSFEEDTGYGSKDSGQAQSLLCQSEESERLDDVSQPHFESSYRDSMIKSMERRRPQEVSQLPYDESSEILDNVCQPEFPPSFEVSDTSSQRIQPQFVESERLEDVTQPSMGTSFPDESPKALGKSLDYRRQKLLSRVNTSEVLDNVSQPFYPTTLEDSMFDRRELQASNQGRKEFEKSEHLDRVSQPVFPSSFEDSRHLSKETERTLQRRPRKKPETCERLIDVSQPFLPSSFEDSKQSSGRYFETPKRRPFPDIDNSENLDDISHPLFLSMYEEISNRQRRSENIPKRRLLPQADESERLEDVSQPDFPSSFKHSTALTKEDRLYKSHAEASKRGPSLDNRPFQQINVSQRISEFSQPEFATSVEDTVPRSIYASEGRPLNQADFSGRISPRYRKTQQQRYLPEVDVSERLSSVCQPEFPSSFEDSRQCSVRNKSNQRTASKRMPKHHMEKPQFDTSEMLEDVAEPEFPSTIQGSMNISRQRSRRPMPQIDLSENIESVCQPEFPQSFEDSTRNDALTYRRDKIPKESLNENLEDISCPSFQETPIFRRRQNEDHRSRGPQRQHFPKEVSRTERSERTGDFRQVFETMPNYAPFEQQVAARKKNLNSRLKMPVTFEQPLGVLGKNKPEVVCPRPQPQSSQRFEPTRENFCVNRMKPSQVNPCTLQVPSHGIQMERRHPSGTRIPLPPSARSQTNIQRQQQQSKLEKPQDQERLVKKSSVKFHQTKSTYFKNQQNKSNRNQDGRR